MGCLNHRNLRLNPPLFGPSHTDAEATSDLLDPTLASVPRVTGTAAFPDALRTTSNSMMVVDPLVPRNLSTITPTQSNRLPALRLS